MAAVAIYSTDAMMRERLQQHLRATSGMTVSGVVDAMPALARLVETTRVDTVLADGWPHELNDWHIGHPGIPIVVLIAEADAESAIRWYYAKKPWKAWASQFLKLITLLATATGG